MDSIKKFLYRFRRYFGAAALFVVLVIILVQCTAPVQRSGRNGNDSTEDDAEATLSKYNDTISNSKLTENADDELVELIEDYYAAYADADLETLGTIMTSVTYNEASYIEAFSVYYEEYDNIDCYSIEVDEDTYLVSVCYDVKFYGVDTAAPGMDFLYVKPNGEGGLCIDSTATPYNFNFMDQEIDADVYSMIITYEQKAEVISLQQSVQERYDDAIASDEQLANLVGGTLRNVLTQWIDSAATSTPEDTEATEDTEETTGSEATETDSEETTGSESSDSEPEDGADSEPSESEETAEPEEPEEAEEPEETTPSTYQVRTKDICNVRASASTSASVLGKVSEGVTLTATGTDGDWTKVEFRGETGYIRSDLLETVG